jgi:hypothetical protein
MNRVIFVALLLSLFVLQSIYANQTKSTSKLYAQGGGKKIVSHSAFALEAENLSCKSCNEEKCPHWKFTVNKEDANNYKYFILPNFNQKQKNL